MITVSNLSKNFDQRMLLQNVSLSIFPNERIGLTGPNGAGKSTLFAIILGQMEPTSGSVQVQKNLKIGYMAQEAKYAFDRTVMDEITSGDKEIRGLLDEKHRLEEEHKADSPRYGDILEVLEKKGIYEMEHKAEKVLTGLGFKQDDFHKPIAHLSGGWQMRTQLAKLLTTHYDLLLLDEPTNYLDLEATLWLKGYLSKYEGTFIIISHDKIFLNDVTNYTIILEDGKMTKVKGNYEAYEEARTIRLRTLEKQKKVIDQKRGQLERFTERFHAQPNRASAVRNKRKMLERLEDIQIPREKHSIHDFQFPRTVESGHTVLSMNRVNKSYGDKQIYTQLEFEMTKGQKICLVGPNGSGKSTLLKMIAGVLPVDSGSRKLGYHVSAGYFSQTRLDVLNPTRTVFEELMSATTVSVPMTQARTLLGVFNFRGDDVFKPVRVLSGGEKSRLILAKLLINPPNFILLDEPTTHLDIDGVEALTSCFKKYAGTLCFISHDLFFVKEIADHIVEVNNGVLKQYPGGLDYYLHKKAGLDTRETPKAQDHKVQAKHPKPAKALSNGSASTPRLKSAEQQHRQALRRLEDIKQETKNFENEQKQLETESYVKSRVLSDTFGRDPVLIKEYGRRLKEIQRRIREIVVTLDKLQEEKIRISK